MVKYCLIFLSLLFVSGCSASDNISDNPLCNSKGITVSIKDKVLLVDVVCSKSDQEKGLMNREVIPDNYGMLFVFKKEDFLSFWMKNTVVPLSIAYIDQDLKIVDVIDMMPLDLTPVRSTKKVLYAIEVNHGWFKNNNITVGDQISFYK